MKFFNFINSFAFAGIMLAVSCNDSNEKSSVKTPETDTTATMPQPSVSNADAPAKITITKEDVPAKAFAAFSKKEPKAKNVQYSKTEKSETDTVVYYYFDYDRDNYSYWLVYDAEGNIVENNSYPKIAGLPDPVSKTLDEYFRGYKILETDKDNDKDMVVYEFELQKGDLKRKAKIATNGGISKLK